MEKTLWALVVGCSRNGFPEFGNVPPNRDSRARLTRPKVNNGMNADSAFSRPEYRL